MEQQTDSKLRKEYVKTAYCHLAYLTYMQSTSCEMLGYKPEDQKNCRSALYARGFPQGYGLIILKSQDMCTGIEQISKVTIYSLDVFLSLFGTSLLFHVQF